MNTSNTGSLTVEQGGRAYTIAYPNRSITQEHLLKILKGENYSLPAPDLFTPQKIIDVGANVGAAAILFHHTYPTASITCCEPSAENLTYLRSNLAQLPAVDILPVALSNHSGIHRLYHGRLHSLQHSLRESPEVNTADYEEIQTVAARDALGSLIVPGTLLKVDTEGSELQILTNLGSLLALCGAICLEYHSEKDRRQIDALLGPTHHLLAATSRQVHRGDVTYLSNEIVDRIPSVRDLAIS
jgi:FkbM family methyltransferase